VEGEKLPEEKPMLTALVSGEFSKGWNGEKAAKDFYYMKGVLEQLMLALRIEGVTVSTAHIEPFLHPGRGCDILVDGKVIGYLGELHPVVAANYDLPQKAVVFELDMREVVAMADKEIVYEAISKFPAIQIDLAFVADKNVEAGALEAAIAAVGGEYLKNIELFDIYEGDRIEAGKKSLAYNLVFRAKERTLKAEEVTEVVETIKTELNEKFGVVLRS
jgi:phenylalanyl-tRNA synthetase beta chain